VLSLRGAVFEKEQAGDLLSHWEAHTFLWEHRDKYIVEREKFPVSLLLSIVPFPCPAVRSPSLNNSVFKKNRRQRVRKSFYYPKF